jgi:SH3 domain-containing protein
MGARASRVKRSENGDRGHDDDCEVTASRLNLRSAPDGDVIGTIPRGATLQIIGERGDWLDVEFEGKHGVVSARFVNRAAPQVLDLVPAAAKAGEVRIVGGNALGPGSVAFACTFKLTRWYHRSATRLLFACKVPFDWTSITSPTPISFSSGRSQTSTRLAIQVPRYPAHHRDCRLVIRLRMRRERANLRSARHPGVLAG